MAYLGLYRHLVTMAAPGHRGGMVASIYVVAYLAVSIPAVVAGIATTAYGLGPTATAYIAAIAILTVVGALTVAMPGRGASSRTDGA